MVNILRKYKDVREIRRIQREKTELAERVYWLSEIEKVKNDLWKQCQKEIEGIRIEYGHKLNLKDIYINELHIKLNENREAVQMLRSVAVKVSVVSDAIKDYTDIKSQKASKEYQQTVALSDAMFLINKEITKITPKVNKIMGYDELKKIDGFADEDRELDKIEETESIDGFADEDRELDKIEETESIDGFADEDRELDKIEETEIID